ncbi:UDP-3-O-(3-hydroxymyristoyl)glucosamine N-acyltransferase [Bertholletia excelsa]
MEVQQSMSLHTLMQQQSRKLVPLFIQMLSSVPMLILGRVLFGPAVTAGQSTNIGYNVALSNCTIGDSCVIHNGACVGQDGFGFFVDEHGDMVKKPQTLKAVIEDRVEIGANTCVDRGSWRDTTIGSHIKIDNLVQVCLAANSCVTKNVIEPGDSGGFPAIPIHEWRRQVASHSWIMK